MSEEMSKPSKVEVGQRWRMGPYEEDDGDEFTYAIVDPYPEIPPGFVHVEYVDKSTGIRTPNEILSDSEFLGYAPGYGPSPAPAPVGGEPTISSGTPDKREAGKAGTAAKGAVLATPPVHSYRGVGEMRSPDGTPLSALAAVPCLRSSDDRPAERWVPSCDIDCDIPDAHGLWRGR